jgi:FixJ family two-component response regulator
MSLANFHGGVNVVQYSEFLPARNAPQVAMSTHSPADAVVYVVDDDPDVQSGLKLLLESVGLACVTFSSVQEFLRNKSDSQSRCLILDVRMPGMGGLDFQKELAEARNEIPIIFITGHGDIPMTVRAMKAGAVEFLTKPLREQDVLDAVQIALERDRVGRDKERRLHALRARFDALSDREREVMMCVITGLLNKQTAAKFGLTESTVKVHRHNLMNKLGAKSVPELVLIAESLGISRPK